jgi:hypothetical protein
MNNRFQKVTSIEDYLNQLPRLNEKMSGNIYYRGQSNVKYKLTPSVLRDHMQYKEHEIYNEIMIECAHEFDNCKLHNEILAKMQHYGVPTRLLDVTTNPLVALYFACESNQDVNGVVYIIKKDKSEIKQYDSDSVSILSSLPRFNFDEKEEILELAQKMSLNVTDKAIGEFNSERIIRRLLHEIKKEKPAFENIINPKDLLENFVFVPRKANARIIRQSGAFIIFGLLQQEIEHIEMSRDNLYNKIIIDKNKKQEIISQLSCFGISKATLHPELYKVAEYIKEKYK